MRMGKKAVSLWSVLVVVIVLISLIVVYTQNKNAMNVYQGEPSTPIETSSAPDVALTTVENREKNFVFGVPEGWKKVIKDGYETYIHPPSATSVQIQIMDYNPNILNVNKESVGRELNNAGYTLGSFQWNSTDSFLSVYNNNPSNKDDMTDYIEETYFDRKTIIRFVYTFYDRNFNRMEQTIRAMMDSFQWQKQEPFPEQYKVLFAPGANFEFAFPVDWNTGVSGNAYIAQSPQTSATISVVANPSKVTYEKMTKVEYQKFASNGRSNFYLKNYNANQNMIFAQSVFKQNNTDMVLTQYLIANGSYEYMVTVESRLDHYQKEEPVFRDLIGLVKIYPPKKAESEQSSEQPSEPISEQPSEQPSKKG